MRPDTYLHEPWQVSRDYEAVSTDQVGIVTPYTQREHDEPIGFGQAPSLDGPDQRQA